MGSVSYTHLDVYKRQEEKNAIYRDVADAQLQAWQKGSGYFYWSYKLLTDTVNENGWLGSGSYTHLGIDKGL